MTPGVLRLCFLELVTLLRFLSSEFTDSHGWIELGQDEFSRSPVRILDIDGLIWESDERYDGVDHALEAAERALAQWIEETLSDYGADVCRLARNGEQWYA